MVFVSSEWNFEVAAVFNIGVVAIFAIRFVMFNELNWEGWLSKSLPSEISEQILTSSSGGREI